MEKEMKANPGHKAKSYLLLFEVAQHNLFLFSQEEKIGKKRFRNNKVVKNS